MKLIVGLGNPGSQYEDTRHNIGFMIADAFCEAADLGGYKNKFHALVAEGVIGHEKVIVAKPQTFMNRSGLTVSELVSFYQFYPEDIIVIHDELDINFAKIKVKKGGGNAGHNGLKDISQKIGTDYFRIRFGIGHPGDKGKVSSYVLKKFSKEEEQTLPIAVDACVEALPYLLEGDMSEFSNQYYQQLGDIKL